MKPIDNEAGWFEFVELIKQIKTTEELNEFLSLFLTLEEKRDVAGRYLIVRELLSAKRTQRQIARELSVSIAKITRGSNFLKTISEKLRRFLIQHCY